MSTKLFNDDAVHFIRSLFKWKLSFSVETFCLSASVCFRYSSLLKITHAWRKNIQTVHIVVSSFGSSSRVQDIWNIFQNHFNLWRDLFKTIFLPTVFSKSSFTVPAVKQSWMKTLQKVSISRCLWKSKEPPKDEIEGLKNFSGPQDLESPEKLASPEL